MTDQWDAPDFGLKAVLGFELQHRDGSVCAVLEIGARETGDSGAQQAVTGNAAAVISQGAGRSARS